MIRVEVRLYAALGHVRPHYPHGVPLALADGATVRSLVRALGLSELEIHLIFVNGTPRDLDHPLNDQDRIGLFPPVGGG